MIRGARSPAPGGSSRACWSSTPRSPGRSPCGRFAGSATPEENDDPSRRDGHDTASFRSSVPGRVALGLLSPAARAGGAAGPVPVKPPAALPPLAIASAPKVPLAFNRLYDYPELTAILKKLTAAHPDLLSLQSLGKSVEGATSGASRSTTRRPATTASKPAMYVDGNIHGNEIQGAEAALYLIWYLAENRDRVEALRSLTDETGVLRRPDGQPRRPRLLVQRAEHHPQLAERQEPARRRPRRPGRRGRLRRPQRRRPDHPDAAEGPATAGSRSRPKTPGCSSRSSRARKPATYELLGVEGIDNDGDGLVNEDPPGGYDMNRNWPADWQPDHVQSGAGDYPALLARDAGGRRVPPGPPQRRRASRRSTTPPG